MSMVKTVDYLCQPLIFKYSKLLKFHYVPATSAASSKGFFATATNSANETNKTDAPLISLSFLDVYGANSFLVTA
jgi:hypothetical protein